MTPENTVCIVVDIQERLTPALHEAEAFTAACRLLIQGLQALNVPMMITEQYPKGLGATLPAIHLLLPDAPVGENTLFSANARLHPRQTGAKHRPHRRGNPHLHPANRPRLARAGAERLPAL